MSWFMLSIVLTINKISFGSRSFARELAKSWLWNKCAWKTSSWPSQFRNGKLNDGTSWSWSSRWRTKETSELFTILTVFLQKQQVELVLNHIRAQLTHIFLQSQESISAIGTFSSPVQPFTPFITQKSRTGSFFADLGNRFRFFCLLAMLAVQVSLCRLLGLFIYKL